MYIIILHVLSTFVKFVTKTEWSLSHQYFSVFRQNDRKRPHFLQRGVLKSVVEGPWKELMNESISQEAINFQQLRNGCFRSVSNNSATWQFCEFYGDVV